MGYYPIEVDDDTPLGPTLFRSITPAWSNQNLHRMAERVRSPLVFAHVRAVRCISISSLSHMHLSLTASQPPPPAEHHGVSRQPTLSSGGTVLADTALQQCTL